MHTTQARIIDRGRGPQIEGSRLTVMDVFYYLHRDHDFDFIRRALPSLTREQFDAVVAYASEHHVELVDADRRVEEWIRRGVAEQAAKGLHPEIDASVPVEERAARLKAKMQQRLQEQAGRNGGHTPR